MRPSHSASLSALADGELFTPVQTLEVTVIAFSCSYSSEEERGFVPKMQVMSTTCHLFEEENILIERLWVGGRHLR